MKKNKVVHFEIPADDLERAKKFYGDIFGWELEDVPEIRYVIAKTVGVGENRLPKEAGAINGGLLKRNLIVTTPSIAIQVDDIETTLEQIRVGGGIVMQEKVPVGDIGYMAYFKDTEGNILSVWQAVKDK